LQRLRMVKKERVAVIKFGVNERGCDGPSIGKVESVSVNQISTLFTFQNFKLQNNFKLICLLRTNENTNFRKYIH